MSRSKLIKSSISGIATVHGQIEEKFDDIKDLYNNDIDKINKLKDKIGLNQIYKAGKFTTSYDLCLSATKLLIKELRFNTKEIDAVIFVTQTPDYFLPGNSNLIHRDLDLNRDCACFDLSQGCSGYIYGLWMAHMLIEINSAEKVLLLAGDTMSKNVNLFDTSSRPLFGDAGTATLVEKHKEIQDSFFTVNTDGSGYDSIIIPAGGFRKRINKIPEDEIQYNDGLRMYPSNIHMDGIKVYNFAIKRAPESIQDILNYSNMKDENIEKYILHQANQYVIKRICKILKFDIEKFPHKTVSKYGNQGPSSIPSTICDIFFNKENLQNKVILLCGFGVGLSWGSAIVKFNNPCILKPKIFETNEK